MTFRKVPICMSRHTIYCISRSSYKVCYFNFCTEMHAYFKVFAFGLIFLPELVNALDCSSNAGASRYESFPQRDYFSRFKTRIEIRLNNRDTTYFVTESFDARSEKGVVSMWAENSSFWGVYYDRLTKEIDRVFEKQCWSFEW